MWKRYKTSSPPQQRGKALDLDIPQLMFLIAEQLIE
jgi:hypothetical protein